MKIAPSIFSVLLPFLGALAVTLVAGLSSCSSFTPYTESVAIDAGFHPATAPDPAFAAVAPYRVQPVTAHGTNVYIYRDDRKGVTYVGGEAEYQRYQQLLASRGAERVDLVNQQMNQEGLHSFR